MSRGESLRLATRGSDLALRQAASVRERLEDRRIAVEIVEVATTGDELRDELIHRLGTTGAFVRSLDEQVLAGEVDAAVHSMKDVPTEAPESLVIAAVPQRGPAHDVLVTPDGAAFEELPEGATVGTSSLRRGAQLRAARPDIQVAPLRGNVDTRVEKLLAPHLQREHERRLLAEEGDTADDDGDEAGEGSAKSDDAPDVERTVEEWFDDLSEIERRALEREVDAEYDAIVLAAAGLERIGLDRHVPTSTLPPKRFVPAPGQGALAVAAVDGDGAARLHDVLDHPRSRVETTVERTILAELGGGCVAPMGVYAILQGGAVTATVRVLARDGTEEVAATRDLPVEDHVDAAVEFAADLAERGAATLIERARRETGGNDGAGVTDGPDAERADDDASTARERRDDDVDEPGEDTAS